MTAPHPLNDFLIRAQKLRMEGILLRALATAATIILIACGLFLLLGVNALTLILLLASLAAGITLIIRDYLRHRRDAYWIAQQIDSKLDLHDELSTAWACSGRSSRFLDTLGDQARRTADTVNLRALFPAPGMQAWRWAALSCVAVVALFAWRWSSLETLDLSAPLIGASVEQQQASAEGDGKKTRAQRIREQLKKMGMPLEEMEGVLGFSAQGGDGKNAGQQQQNAQGQAMQQGGQKPPENAKNQTAGQQPGENGQEAKEGNQGPPPQKGPQQGNMGQQASAPQQQNSLFDKMKDALSSLQDKLSGQQNQQAQQQQKNAQQAAGQQGQKAQSSEGEQSKQGNQAGQPQDASNNKSNGNEQAQSSPNQNKSGQGSSDGDKNIAEQKQAEAMGKISEILGRRAENINGDMQLKTSSKNNRLTTDYVEQTARSSDADQSVRSREEISLEAQAYIKRYFTALHKNSKTVPVSRDEAPKGAGN